MITVFDGDNLVGNASLGCVFDKKKTRHRAEFGIAILKSDWGQGLGQKLVSELIAAAKQAGYDQLELEVVATNTAAISLYKKLGYWEIDTVPCVFNGLPDVRLVLLEKYLGSDDDAKK